MNRRIRNVKRNIFHGILNKVILLALGFVERTCLIYILGVKFLGITSLYKSILDVLSLAEFGFGTAMVYSMYKPVADGNNEQVCALLNFYKKCYRVIGSVIFILGMIMMPFLPYFISGDIPNNINIYILYFISLLNTSISYFLWAYRNSILIANQRNDLISKCTSASSIIGYILKLGLLWLTKNYYVYMIAALSINVLNNIFVYYISKKLFPEYIEKGKLSKAEYDILKGKLKGLFVYKIGNIVSNSADNIVISAYLGLTILGIYNNYYYIISTLFGFLTIYYNSMTASLGNSVVTESVEKNYETFINLFRLQNWIIGFSTVSLLCLYQPFMQLWVGEDLMLDFTTVVFLSLYFYVWKIQDIVTIYKEAAGMWDKDKIRPLCSAVFNLALNLILVRFIGLNGVIISTTIAQLLIGLPWASKVLFQNYFHVSVKNYFVLIGKAFLLLIFIALATYEMVALIYTEGIIGLIIKAAICLLVPNTIYGFIFCKQIDFKIFIKKCLFERE